MRKIPLYQIDAFSSRVFAGNPAAVCPLEAWLDDSLLQAIAQENNLSETAFFIPDEKVTISDGLRLWQRWICADMPLWPRLLSSSTVLNHPALKYPSNRGAEPLQWPERMVCWPWISLLNRPNRAKPLRNCWKASVNTHQRYCVQRTTSWYMQVKRISWGSSLIFKNSRKWVCEG